MAGEGTLDLRKLGIIGGASWSSTALYYDHINRMVAHRLGGLHSARLIIESLDFEDDYASFHRRDDWEGANRVIVAAAERLKAAGAQGLLLASNTMHKAADAVLETEPFARAPYEARDLVIHELTPGWRTEIDRIIYEELAVGRVVRDSQRKLKTLITELSKQKVQAVVLGCTELVLAVDVRANVIPVYDTTAIHARAAVEWMLNDEEAARAAA